MNKFIPDQVDSVVSESSEVKEDELKEKNGDLCVFNVEKYQMRKQNKFTDKRKNDIISIEDDIYNLAFRPARRFGQRLLRAPRGMLDNLTSVNGPGKKISLSRIYDYYNMTQQLAKLVEDDLLAKSFMVS